MKQLTLYFSTALKQEIKGKPTGSRAALARKAEVSPAAISDILGGRRYGSEEVRRSIASALGWNYDELLKYGQCLVEGTDYKPPASPVPPYTPQKYLAVSLCTRLTKAAGPGGQIYLPEQITDNQPLLIHKAMAKHSDEGYLTAFKMPDASMAPTIEKNDLLIADVSMREPEDGNIYVLARDDDSNKFMIRRLRFKSLDSEFFLTCDNQAHQPELLKKPFESIVVAKLLFGMASYE